MFEGTDSMEDPPTYLKGDIVWVKLSGYWWPGEVINEKDLPSDLLSDFKKPPLVIVKFFEEDSYEYIKHWSGVYPYNCEKKNEFIKKGMAGYRAKLSHLAKFPRDIGTAEEKTNGNPNILSQPEFLPNKKINYDEIFGTPPPKKSAKGKNSSSVSKKSSTKDSNEPLITHRRFLGNDDYRAYIWVQYPGKDCEADEEIEEVQRLNEEPTEFLTCQACMFKTKRLGVMLMHTKMHLNGVNITSKRKNKKTEDSETEGLTEKSPKPKQRKKKEEPKSKPRDVFTDLLEEWDDTDEETDELGDKLIKAKSEGTENEKDDKNITGQEEKSTTNHVSETSGVVETPKNKNTQDDIKNCFDFDEEEEEDDFLLPASSGRKIPRVIPEKPKASISELLEMSQKEDEIETLNKPNVKPTECESADDNKEILRSSAEDTIENTFRQLMEETEVPALGDLSQTLKPEQNFHDARTVKFPDKGGTSLKGGTSRKRFVTSFEDFEAGFRKIEDEQRSRLFSEKEGKFHRKATPIKIGNKDLPEQIPESSKKLVEQEETVSEPHQEVSLISDSVPTHERKTRQSEEKQSSLSILEEIKDVSHIEIEPDKKARRRTKQLVVDEDSEEIIELTLDDHTDKFVVEAEKIVNQLDREARGSLAAFDAELEAIKKDLAVSPKISHSTEKSKETRMSLEQLTRELEGSCDSADISVDIEPDKTREGHQSHYQKTRRKTKSTSLIDVELDDTLTKRRKDRLRKSLKEDSQSAKELPVEEVRSSSLLKEVSPIGPSEVSDAQTDTSTCVIEAEKEPEVLVPKRKSAKNKHLKRQSVAADDTSASATVVEDGKKSEEVICKASSLEAAEVTFEAKETDAVSETASASDEATYKHRKSRARRIAKNESEAPLIAENSAIQLEVDKELVTASESSMDRLEDSSKKIGPVEPDIKEISAEITVKSSKSLRSRARKPTKKEETDNLAANQFQGTAEKSSEQNDEAVGLVEPLEQARVTPDVASIVEELVKAADKNIEVTEKPIVHEKFEAKVFIEEATAKTAAFLDITIETPRESPTLKARRSKSRKSTKIEEAVGEPSEAIEKKDIEVTEKPLEVPEKLELSISAAETSLEKETSEESALRRGRSRKSTKTAEQLDAGAVVEHKGADEIGEKVVELTSSEIVTELRRGRSRKSIKTDEPLGDASIVGEVALTSQIITEKPEPTPPVKEMNAEKAETSQITVENIDLQSGVGEALVSKLRRGRSRKSASTEGEPFGAAVIEPEGATETNEVTKADVAAEEEISVEKVAAVESTKTEALEEPLPKLRRGKSQKSSKVEEPLEDDTITQTSGAKDCGLGVTEKLDKTEPGPIEEEFDVKKVRSSELATSEVGEPTLKIRRGRSRKTTQLGESSDSIPPLEGSDAAGIKSDALSRPDGPVLTASIREIDVKVPETSVGSSKNLDSEIKSEATSEPSEAKIRRGRSRKGARSEEPLNVELEESAKVIQQSEPAIVARDDDAKVADTSDMTVEGAQLAPAEPEIVHEKLIPKLRRGKSRKSSKVEDLLDEKTVDGTESKASESVDIESDQVEGQVEPFKESTSKTKRGKHRKSTKTDEVLDVAPEKDDEFIAQFTEVLEPHVEAIEESSSRTRHGKHRKITLDVAPVVEDSKIVHEKKRETPLAAEESITQSVEVLQQNIEAVEEPSSRSKSQKINKIEEPLDVAPAAQESVATSHEKEGEIPRTLEESIAQSTEVLEPNIEAVKEPSSKTRHGKTRKNIKIGEPSPVTHVGEESVSETSHKILRATEESTAQAMEVLEPHIEAVEETRSKTRHGKSRKSNIIEEPLEVAPIVQEPVPKTSHEKEDETPLAMEEPITRPMEVLETHIEAVEEPGGIKTRHVKSQRVNKIVEETSHRILRAVEKSLIQSVEVSEPNIETAEESGSKAHSKSRRSNKLGEPLDVTPILEESVSNTSQTMKEPMAQSAKVLEPNIEPVKESSFKTRHGKSRRSNKIEETLDVAPGIEVSIPKASHKKEHETAGAMEQSIVQTVEDIEAESSFKTRQGKSRRSKKIEEPLDVVAPVVESDPQASLLQISEPESEEVDPVITHSEGLILKIKRGKSRRTSTKTEEPTSEGPDSCENKHELLSAMEGSLAEPTEAVSKDLEITSERLEEPSVKIKRGKSRRSTKSEAALDLGLSPQEVLVESPSAAEPKEMEAVIEPSEELSAKIKRGKSRRSTKIEAETDSGLSPLEEPQTSLASAESSKEVETVIAFEEPSSKIKSRRSTRLEAAQVVEEIDTNQEQESFEELISKVKRGKSQKSTKLDDDISVLGQSEESQTLLTTEPESKGLETIAVPSTEPSSKDRGGKSKKSTSIEEPSDIVSVVEEADFKLNRVKEPQAPISAAEEVQKTKPLDVKIDELVPAEASSSKTSENDQAKAVSADVYSEKPLLKQRRGKSRWDTLETIASPSIIGISESKETAEVMIMSESPVKRSALHPEAAISLEEPVEGLLKDDKTKVPENVEGTDREVMEPELIEEQTVSRVRRGRSRKSIKYEEPPDVDPVVEVTEIAEKPSAVPEKFEAEISNQEAEAKTSTHSGSIAAVKESLKDDDKTEVPEAVSALADAEILSEPIVAENDTSTVSVHVPSEPTNDQHSEAQSELELKSEKNQLPASKEISFEFTSNEAETSTSKGKKSKSRKHSHLDKVMEVEMAENTVKSSGDDAETAENKATGLGVDVKNTHEKDTFTELPFELIGMLEKRKSSRRHDRYVEEQSYLNESYVKYTSKSLEESPRSGRDRKRKLSGEIVPKEPKEDSRRSKYHKKIKPSDVEEPAQNEELNRRLTENVDTYREARYSRSRDSKKDRRRSRSPKQLTDAIENQRGHEDYSRDGRKERERRRRSRSPKKLLVNLDRMREDRLPRSRDSRRDIEEKRRSRSPKQILGDSSRSRSRDSKKEIEEKYRSRSHRKSKTKLEEPSHSDSVLEDAGKQSSESEQSIQETATYAVVKDDGFQVSSPRKTAFTGIVSDTLYGRKSKVRPARSKLSRWDVVIRPDGDQAYEIPKGLPKSDDKLSDTPDVLIEKVGSDKDLPKTDDEPSEKCGVLEEKEEFGDKLYEKPDVLVENAGFEDAYVIQEDLPKIEDNTLLEKSEEKHDDKSSEKREVLDDPHVMPEDLPKTEVKPSEKPDIVEKTGFGEDATPVFPADLPKIDDKPSEKPDDVLIEKVGLCEDTVYVIPEDLPKIDDQPSEKFDVLAVRTEFVEDVPHVITENLDKIDDKSPEKPDVLVDKAGSDEDTTQVISEDLLKIDDKSFEKPDVLLFKAEINNTALVISEDLPKIDDTLSEKPDHVLVKKEGFDEDVAHVIPDDLPKIDEKPDVLAVKTEFVEDVSDVIPENLNKIDEKSSEKPDVLVVEDTAQVISEDLSKIEDTPSEKPDDVLLKKEGFDEGVAHIIPEDLPKIDDKPSEKSDVLVEKGSFVEDENTSVLVMTNHHRNKVYLETETSDKESCVNVEHQIQSKVQAGIFEPSKDVEDDVLENIVADVIEKDGQELKSEDAAAGSRNEIEPVKELVKLEEKHVENLEMHSEFDETKPTYLETDQDLSQDLDPKFTEEQIVEHKSHSGKKRKRSRRSKSITDHISPERDVPLAIEGKIEAPPSKIADEADVDAKTTNESLAHTNVPIEAESGAATFEDSKLDSEMEQETIANLAVVTEDEAKDISVAAETLDTAIPQDTLCESMEIEVPSAEPSAGLDISVKETLDSVVESVCEANADEDPSATVDQHNADDKVESTAHQAVSPPEHDDIKGKSHLEDALIEEVCEASNVGDVEAESKLDFAASHGESQIDSGVVDVSSSPVSIGASVIPEIEQTEDQPAEQPVVVEEAVINVLTDSLTVAEADLQSKEPSEVVKSDSSIGPDGIRDQIVAEDLSLTKIVTEPAMEENDNVTVHDVSAAPNDRVMVQYSGAEDLSTKDRIPQSSEEIAAISDPSPSVPLGLFVPEPAQTFIDHFEDRLLSPNKDQIEIPSEVAKAIDVLDTDLSKEAASEPSHEEEDIKDSIKKGKKDRRRKYSIVDEATEKLVELGNSEDKLSADLIENRDISFCSEHTPQPQIACETREVLDEKTFKDVVDLSGPQDLSPSVVDVSSQMEHPSKKETITKLEGTIFSIRRTKKVKKSKRFSQDTEQAPATDLSLEPEKSSVLEQEPQKQARSKKSRPRKYSKQETSSEGPVDYSIKHLNEDSEKESGKADEESSIEHETGGGSGEEDKKLLEEKSPEAHPALTEQDKKKPSIDKLKSMPPKKSRWSRRGSYTKKDSDNEQETALASAQVDEKPAELESSVIEKTDHSSLESTIHENSASSFNDSEIILPPKKSKRVNEVSSQFFSDDFHSPEKKSDADSLCFPSYDDSFMSTTLRNNIEGLIKEIDSIDSNVIPDHLELQTVENDFKPFEMPEVKSEAPISEHLSVNSPLSEDSRGGLEVPKGVPPKKKKIDLSKDEHFSLPPNNLPQHDVSKPEEKVIDAAPQPPKKKMQKLFENSQAVEKVDKTPDFLLMSPLAKKKSFLFHHEEFDQTQKEISQPQKEVSTDLTREAGKLSDPPQDSVYNTEADVVDEFLDLPKIRKKRKSSSLRDHPPKKEKLDEKEIITSDHDQKSKDSFSSSALQKAAETPLSDITGFSTPVGDDSKPSVSNNEMEVKIEESDFKFNIQTNLSILSTSKAEELSALASKTLSEIKKDVIAECPCAFKTEKKSEVAPPTLNQPELVPISVTPTVMSEKDLADAQVEITTDKVISEKKPTFPIDFGDRAAKTEPGPTKATETVGTEFTSKAMVKDFDNRPLTSQPNAYALKSELLDILEGNSNSSTNSSGSEQKFKTSYDNYDKNSTVQGIIDFEEAIPSQIVLSNKVSAESVLMESPKLLERLSMSSDPSKSKAPTMLIQGDMKVNESLSKVLMSKLTKATGGIPKPGQKIVIKTQKAISKGTKPIILSEQIIRPANAAPSAVKSSGQAQGLKRQYEDVEDVETAFIIPKIAKKTEEEEEVAPPTPVEKPSRSRGSKISGKAKILQQTIITPKGECGEVIPQAPSTTATKTIQLQQVQIQPGQDDAVFDINSMPIVLSDDILTPESIQNMPVVLSEEVLPQSTAAPAAKAQEKLLSALPKKVVSGMGTKQIIFKTTQPGSVTSIPLKHAGKPRILQTPSAASSSKIVKPTATALLATGTTPDGKPAKYVLVPPSVTPATTQVKTVKQAVVKKQLVAPSKLPTPATATATAVDQVVGNKIMIVTNAQGQQTRVVLTPQQQKAFMQAQPGSKTKTIIKGAIPKALLESAAAVAAAGPSGVAKTVATVAVPGPVPPVSSHGGLVMPAVKSVKAPVPPKKGVQKTASKPQKTILIKNQLGQTVRKIQGTDDDDLDRQVAEQLEAIKASARLQQANKTPEIINYTNRQIPSANSRSAIRKSYSKKVDPLKVKIPAPAPQAEAQKSQEASVPALAPLSPQPRISQVQNQITQIVTKQAPPRKVEPPSASSSVNKTLETASHLQRQQTIVPVKSDGKPPAAPTKEVETKRPESPLRQVVIQDGLGNLTTVTVGQILAIPSETVDGQPQSYMLVTVDESGNLTPLNNDALMSLDPSLGAAGDVNNMMLQVDQGQQGTVAAIKPAESTVAHTVEEKKKVEERVKSAQPVKEPKAKPHEVPLAVEQQIVIGEGVLPGDAGGQQLIVTGDPIATQKFLESLSDGSTDLANILANAEGGSVLIQADGQQILIRTNPGAQPMMGITESTEGAGNPIFATHKPNQDILAAALANTDVFQPTDQLGSQTSPVKGLQPSQLSPGGGAGLYPMHVGNVLETSLTLSSPIMTPLEVPSTNSKKIDDEADILNQVPKNVDLPITITDPNISQTVAHQQAAGLMELTLPISETGPSADINSPSYSYSLPTLEESVGISQKPFSGSMPLLTEDVVEVESSGSGSSNLDRMRVSKELRVTPSSFSPNFGSLPMLPETIESSREEVVKTSTFGDIGSLPMLADDVIEDSGSSMGSNKPARSSPKPIERDIVDEGLSTLGGEMCSSLSEPPPDMFDLSSLTHKEEEVSSDISSIPEPETLSITSENSGEIPIQPPIVATLSDLKRPGDDSDGSDEKRTRFD